MGHSFREMFPERAAAQDARLERHASLRREIRELPLGNFTVANLPGILRVMDSMHFGSPFPDDLSSLETKVAEIRAKERAELGEPVSEDR